MEFRICQQSLFTIWLIVCGERIVEIDGTRHEAKPGSLVMIQPGALIRTDFPPG
jgi:hypothetical protein